MRLRLHAGEQLKQCIQIMTIAWLLLYGDARVLGQIKQMQ